MNLLKLLKIHYKYLFSNRLFIILYIMLTFILVLSIYFSRFYYTKSDLVFNKAYYQIEYLLEMSNFLKITILLFIIINLIISYEFSKYDYFFLTRVSRKTFYLSKLLIFQVINAMYLVNAILIVYIIPLFLSEIIDKTVIRFSTLLYFLIFTLFYSNILLLIFQLGKHVSYTLIGFGFYLLLFINSEFLVIKEDVNVIYKTLSLLLIDLSIYDSTHFESYYSLVYYLSLTTIFLLVNISVFIRPK